MLQEKMLSIFILAADCSLQ